MRALHFPVPQPHRQSNHVQYVTALSSQIHRNRKQQEAKDLTPIDKPGMVALT